MSKTMNETLVQIIDLKGIIVFQQKIEGKTKRLDVSGLNNGLYNLRVIGTNGWINKTILIEQ
jgi:hypothetical protein